MTPIRFLVDRRDRYTEVRLTGTLDRRAVPAVGRLLMECLAEEPGAVLADLSAVDVPEPAALEVLADAAEQAALWPEIPILAYPALEAAGAPRAAPGLVLCDTRREACDRADAERGRPSLRDDLLPVAGAARRGRELTTEACLTWDIPERFLGPACLLVTELITNAATHAGTMMTLALTHSGRHLQISVRDGSDDFPVRRSVPPLSPEPGRGLLLVEAIAARWGALPLAGGGKVVWSVLDLPADSPDPLPT